ncbi:MAG: FMN-binding glutamate synthase family protein [Lysobacterales bacterium]|jgi:glutamate synthase domain-containing protein 2
MRRLFQIVLAAVAVLLTGFFLFEWPLHTLVALVAAITALGLYDLLQRKHTILRIYPVVGHARYLFESIGPEIRQYFVESDTDGTPIDRNHRAYVYKRAKRQNQTHPFGTERDLNRPGYAWMPHSIYPAEKLDQLPRVTIGGPDCSEPYSASLFNISAMSYGALGPNAITALNRGAAAGGFFHDTGEGGISPYHLNGGDLVWEIGTGYFGCRTRDGGFSAEKFKEQAARPEVRMVEIKISQGAKPGHGGVLPAAKNSKEIARIRGVEPHTEVLSPPGHRTFSDARGLLEFVQTLRRLSVGKPVGFKLCIGSRREFEEVCEQMVETGIKPDFITVDGAEGGTGAAPIVFSNHVGMPWEKALIFVVDTLIAYDLKKDIRVLTATKIFTAFNIFHALCLGADVCSTARGMMLALGCIQSLSCNTNKCPTGVATTNPARNRGLVVEEKWRRVRNYHEETVNEFLEIFAAAGCRDLVELNRSLVFTNIDNRPCSYEDIYPTPKAGERLVPGAQGGSE